MHVVFHSTPPHPIIQPEPTIKPTIPPMLSEIEDIDYTQASNQEELLKSFQTLAKNIKESSGMNRYSAILFSISYVDEKMFPSFIESELPESIYSVSETEISKKRRKDIDDQFFLFLQRCVLPFSQMIVNDNQNVKLLEKIIIKAKLNKSIHLLRSIYITIRLTQWVSNSERNVQTLQIILLSLSKIKMSEIPYPLAIEIAHSLIITAFLFQTLSSSDLYLARKYLIICLSKLLIDQPNSFANASTIECLNYLNEHDINYTNMHINTSSSKPFYIDSHKNPRFLTAIPAIDALRIPEKVPIISILQQIRFTLFSVNIYDMSNLLNIAAISLSSQSAIIRHHPELVNLEDYNKIFFGRCLSIDTASKFIKFDKTPKNIVELASFLRSNHISKTAHLNALTKDLGKIINVVYMSLKRLPKVSTDFQTLISATKIISFFISHVSQKKLIQYGVLKRNTSLTPQSQLIENSVSTLIGLDVKTMTKKVKKMLFRANFTSLLPPSFTFISEMAADSLVASPFFPHFTNSPTFRSSCCPESFLLLAAFEELAKSLAHHPQDFLTVLTNTNTSPGRVKLLTVALKSVIESTMTKNDDDEKRRRNRNTSKNGTTKNKKKKNLETTVKSDADEEISDIESDNEKSNNNDNDDEDENDNDDFDDDDDFECINESSFVDEQTVEVWKRMIKTNLNRVCQFGLSILKIPSEITCKIAADFFLTIVAFVSIFLQKDKDVANDDKFLFSYDDVYAVLFLPISMLIEVSNKLFQLEPLCNPKIAIFFLGFIERIVSREESPDLDLSATVLITKEIENSMTGDDIESDIDHVEKKQSVIKLKTKVNATAIVKSFFVLNGPIAFWDCLFNMINLPISSVCGTLAARAMRILASISDFGNTLQIRLPMAQRLVIDVLHNSIITNIIDMLNKMTIENFENISLHEKCVLSLAMAQLLLSWCEPLPLAAFVSARVSSELLNLIEKLSFAISDSNSGFTSIKKGNGSNNQTLTLKQKQSLIFENSVLEIMKEVKDRFDFVLTQDYDDDLVIAQQSIPPENIPQKLSGLFFMALKSIMQTSDTNIDE